MKIQHREVVPGEHILSILLTLAIYKGKPHVIIDYVRISFLNCKDEQNAQNMLAEHNFMMLDLRE